MEKQKKRVNFINSLSTKISIIMFFSVTLAVSLTGLVCLTRTEASTITMVKNYAQSIAEDYARSLDGAVTGGVEITNEICASMVAGAQMIGVESSYIYVCDSQGMMMYHPTASKIGAKVENEAVNAIVDNLSKGIKQEPGALIYDFNGVKKLAGYCVTNSNLIVVMTADYADALADYTKTSKKINNINALDMVTVTLIAYAICRRFLRIIPKLVDIVEDTSQFDFRYNPELEKLTQRKDELGLISKAIFGMRASLREIVTNIDESSETLTENIEDLKQGALHVNAMCTDNSATTQQLAAGMEETSATTETINDNIHAMLGSAKDIDTLALDGEKLSDNVSIRAKELKAATVESTKKTEEIYVSVKNKADVAIENAKIVSKINEMTDQIMQISSQTSLLALNASIEAARAGDSGRGFAVVATEIGNLATQTSKTVGDIDRMVTEVIASVNQMQECLEETTTFIGENVIADYKEFEKVSDQYDADASEFKSSMNDIRAGVTELNDSINTVADSISGINTTINEAAHGVTGIAKNTSDIARKTNDTADKANDCKDEIVKFDEIVSRFILD